MKIREITKDEFQKISEAEKTYFQNGVVFDERTDNLIAFEKLEENNTFSFWVVS